jgi:hypothetical protein
MARPIKAYRYCGVTFLKFGSRKSSPGVLYQLKDLQTGLRPNTELWRDGTITYHDRPEGTVDQMSAARLPSWAYDYEIKPFKSRS